MTVIFIVGRKMSSISNFTDKNQHKNCIKYSHNRQGVRAMVFNAIFNNISIILWLSVLFIGGGNQITLRKSSTCHKSLTNFII